MGGPGMILGPGGDAVTGKGIKGLNNEIRPHGGQPVMEALGRVIHSNGSPSLEQYVPGVKIGVHDHGRDPGIFILVQDGSLYGG